MEGIGAFLPLILIFGVFYILLIRPQQKKVKQHREMLNDLKRGDKIITSGGIIGKVNKVNENNMLQKSEIKTGTRKAGYLEVVSGLISGEKVVAEGLTKVRPNMKIKPIIKP